jgi:hypothetical protein
MSATSVCPFCVWAACGLLLVLCAPELAALVTPAGPSLLWLVLIPFASALMRRWMRALPA